MRDLLWMSTVMRRLMRSQQSADRCAGMSYCAATMRGNMRFSRDMLRGADTLRVSCYIIRSASRRA